MDGVAVGAATMVVGTQVLGRRMGGMVDCIECDAESAQPIFLALQDDGFQPEAVAERLQRLPVVYDTTDEHMWMAEGAKPEPHAR